MTIPAEYRAGYERARQVDPVLTERYLSHTTVGDPEADALIETLSRHPREHAHRWIEGGIEGKADALRDAPDGVRDFFAALEPVPAWWDARRASIACKAFHRNSEIFMVAVAAATMVEGFATLIAKPFSITGKMVDSGVRRLRQNNRHILELMMPQGLERQSDGWKLSLRARLVHARIRNLLRHSPEWDEAAWGTPLSAAHMGVVNAAFAALLLKRVAMMGVDLSAEEREAHVMIWRYSGHLMGIAPAFSYESEAAALRLHRIAGLCEPPPSLESIFLAHSVIHSAPILANIDQPGERRRMAHKLFQVSRALIGNDLARQLNYPPTRGRGVLARVRWRIKFNRFVHDRVPALGVLNRADQFQKMLDISHYADEGLRYRLPQHVHVEKEQPS